MDRLKLRERGSVHSVEPLTWFPVYRSDLPQTADIVCSDGHHDTLVTEKNLGTDVPSYDVDSTGVVTPTYACRGGDKCEFKGDIQLEGWTVLKGSEPNPEPEASSDTARG